MICNDYKGMEAIYSRDKHHRWHKRFIPMNINKKTLNMAPICAKRPANYMSKDTRMRRQFFQKGAC